MPSSISNALAAVTMGGLLAGGLYYGSDLGGTVSRALAAPQTSPGRGALPAAPRAPEGRRDRPLAATPTSPSEITQAHQDAQANPQLANAIIENNTQAVYDVAALYQVDLATAAMILRRWWQIDAQARNRPADNYTSPTGFDERQALPAETLLAGGRVPFNEQGWDAFLETSPESTNVENRVVPGVDYGSLRSWLPGARPAPKWPDR